MGHLVRVSLTAGRLVPRPGSRKRTPHWVGPGEKETHGTGLNKSQSKASALPLGDKWAIWLLWASIPGRGIQQNGGGRWALCVFFSFLFLFFSPSLSFFQFPGGKTLYPNEMLHASIESPSIPPPAAPASFAPAKHQSPWKPVEMPRLDAMIIANASMPQF